jgi:hypothetical protein
VSWNSALRRILDSAGSTHDLHRHAGPDSAVADAERERSAGAGKSQRGGGKNKVIR